MVVYVTTWRGKGEKRKFFSQPIIIIFRLITGNYKSNGNLVSLKVDIIDFTEFQRFGCLVSPGAGAGGAATPSSLPHSHSITGTLFCQPDTNTVRLNLTVLGPCSSPLPPLPSTATAHCGSNSTRQLWDDALASLSIQHELGQKDVKPWIMTSNKMAGGAMDNKENSNGHHVDHHHLHHMQYSPFTSPVSPPCSQEGPPPLLDFHSDQLMSEIQSMTFDSYVGGGLSLNSQLFGGDSNVTTAVVAASSLLLHSPPSSSSSSGISNSSNSSLGAAQQSALLASQAGHQAGNNNSAITTTTTTTRGELKVSSLVNPTTTTAVADHLLLQSSQANNSNNTLVNNVPTKSAAASSTASSNSLPFLLLQPKIERSDSICSEYSNPGMRDDFLSYSDMGPDLDDLEAEAASYAVSPPMVVVSAASSGIGGSCYPLLFPPFGGSQAAVSPIGKAGGVGGLTNNMFFSKSFNRNSSHQQHNKLDNSSGSSSSCSSSPLTQNEGVTTMAWSPSSSSLALSEAMTPPAAALMTTTTVKSPIIIPLPTAGPSTTGGFGMLNSGHSSPKTPQSVHCAASPQSAGSGTDHQQQQQLMLGSPLHSHHSASPKARNRRNSSFDESKPHVCPQCGARFTTKSNLGQHAKIHLAVKPFICEICSHGFTRAAHYESHVAKHKGLKTHR